MTKDELLKASEEHNRKLETDPEYAEQWRAKVKALIAEMEEEFRIESERQRKAIAKNMGWDYY